MPEILQTVEHVTDPVSRIINQLPLLQLENTEFICSFVWESLSVSKFHCAHLCFLARLHRHLLVRSLNVGCTTSLKSLSFCKNHSLSDVEVHVTSCNNDVFIIYNI